MPLLPPRSDLTLRVCDRSGAVEIVGDAQSGRMQLVASVLCEGEQLHLTLPSGDILQGKVATLPAEQTEHYPGLCFRLLDSSRAKCEPGESESAGPSDVEAPPARGVQGNLLDLSVADVVQAMELCGKTVQIAVVPQEGPTGQVFLHQGEVVCASCGELEGEEAFYHLATTTHGHFTIAFTPDSSASDSSASEVPARNVNAKVTHLLLEAARRLDEASRQAEAVDDDEQMVGDDDRTTEEPVLGSGDSSCVFDLIEDSIPAGLVEAAASDDAAPSVQGGAVFGGFFDRSDSSTEVDEPTVRMAVIH